MGLIKLPRFEQHRLLLRPEDYSRAGCMHPRIKCIRRTNGIGVLVFSLLLLLTIKILPQDKSQAIHLISQNKKQE